MGVCGLALVLCSCDGRSNKEDAQDLGSVTVNLPSAKPVPTATAAPEDNGQAPLSEGRTEPLRDPTPAEARREQAEDLTTASAGTQDDASDKRDVKDSEAAGGTTAAKRPSEPVGTTAAKLPLSDAVVARTIERIGYACGEVAGTTPINDDTQVGSYKVTCSSGDSYRASLVDGRYRFRRLSNTGSEASR